MAADLFRLAVRVLLLGHLPEAVQPAFYPHGLSHLVPRVEPFNTIVIADTLRPVAPMACSLRLERLLAVRDQRFRFPQDRGLRRPPIDREGILVLPSLREYRESVQVLSSLSKGQTARAIVFKVTVGAMAEIVSIDTVVVAPRVGLLLVLDALDESHRRLRHHPLSSE